MRKTTFFKTLLVAACLCLGSMSAWAEATSIYERGTTTAWSDTDLSNWPCDYATPTISNGLNVSTTNGGWACTKSISVTSNAIVTLNATLKTGGAPGRSGSYEYIQIGGVKIGFNEQDKIAFVDVDGSSSNLTLTYTRNADYDISIVINTATNDVTYEVGSASGSSSSSTPITSVVFGHYKAGKENYGINPILKKIEVLEEVQAVSTADYTINYIFNSGTIKTVPGNTAIDAVVYADNPITISGVKYYAKDNVVTSMTITDGTNVLNVDLRRAETWNYKVYAKNGATTLKTLVSSTITEGESVTVFYPRYILKGTTLYSSGTGAVSYSTTFTPNADNYVEDIPYNSGTVINVAFYTEGEDVADNEATNADRASMGKMGYTGSSTTYNDVTTLSPGKYVLYMRGQNGNAAEREYSFKVGGDDPVFTGKITNGTNQDVNSGEFTVDATSTLSFACEGSSKSGVDYFYAVKTGEAKTISSAGWATYCSPYALDFSSSIDNLTAAYLITGNSGVTLTLSEITGTIPAETGILLKGNGTCAIPVIDSSDTDVSSNLLKGVLTNTNKDQNNIYVLMNGDNGIGFYKNANETAFTVGANTAYLNVEDISSARAFIGFDDEETTGVQHLEEKNFVFGDFFDLQGRRVAQPTKGLYIVNGRKIVIK